jgi:hypothetical protein
MSEPTNTAEQWPQGADLDRAMESAFHDAVRRHRAANEPMVMWENGEARHVSPFEIPLPGEDLPRVPNPHAEGASAELPKRRASGAD